MSSREKKQINVKTLELLKRTATSLATRFETTSQWLEIFLVNSLQTSDILFKDVKPEYQAETSILDDEDLKIYFLPDIVMPLSILGAEKTMELFEVDTSDYVENDFTSSTRVLPLRRNWTKKEARAVEKVIQGNSSFLSLFKSIPPPLPDSLDIDEESLDEETAILIELLKSYQNHLQNQKDDLISYSGEGKKIFEDYAWFEKAFDTRLDVPVVIYRKGLLVDRSKDYFPIAFKNENEKTEFSAKPQEKIKLSLKSSSSNKYRTLVYPQNNESASNLADRLTKANPLDSNERVKSADIALREKIFAARISTLTFLIEYLEGKNLQEPNRRLAEYIKDEFSRSEFSALRGLNPQYFGFPEDTKYSYALSGTLERLLLTCFQVPSIVENRVFKKYYKNTRPIYDYSSDVDGPHLLDFSYYDALDLINEDQLEGIVESADQVSNRLFSQQIYIIELLNKYFRLKSVALSQSYQEKVDEAVEKSLGQTDVVIPYVHEILNAGKKTKPKTGIFTEDYKEYRPLNNNLPIFHFTDKQAAVIKILHEAFYNWIDYRVKRSVLIEKLYGKEKAKEIAQRSPSTMVRLNKHESKRRRKKNQKPNPTEKIVYKYEYRYEWRLEKTLIKEDHPAWVYGLVKSGGKIGNEKTYCLSFDFEKKK